VFYVWDLPTTVDYDSLVGIEIRYGLDGPGIEFWCVRAFPYPSRRPLGPTQSPIQSVPALFTGGKTDGRGVNHPLPSSFEVKERVELCL
jgi:hypothetical protein